MKRSHAAIFSSVAAVSLLKHRDSSKDAAKAGRCPVRVTKTANAAAGSQFRELCRLMLAILVIGSSVLDVRNGVIRYRGFPTPAALDVPYAPNSDRNF